MTRPSGSRLKLTTDRAAAALVTLAPLVYFFAAVRGRLFISPDDGVIFNVPLRVAAARILRAGYLPLWNPYIFSGMPLHGAAQGGLLFPLNWFYVLFPPPAATNLMMLSSYALAALGAYLYARRAGACVAGAVVTSLSWQWGAFLVNQIGHTNVVQTAAVLPWVLWAVDGYGMSGGRVRGALLSALVALQVFAGHQQTLAYSLLLASAYAASSALASKETRGRYARSLGFIALGLPLAAVQILPTFELLRNSPRAEATYEFFTSYSMPRRFLLTLVAPYLHGGGDGHLFRAPYTGPPFYAEYVPYVGLAALMLACAALLIRPDARTLFWAVAALACLSLALGRFFPFGLYRVVYHVPVLNLFRVPARYLMCAEFALAALAGRGVTVIAKSRGDARTLRRVSLVALGVLLAACLAVTWGRPAEFRLGRQAPVSFLRAPELFVPIVFAALSACAVWNFARARSNQGAAFLWLLVVLMLDLGLWGQTSGWRTHSPQAGDELWREPATVAYLRALAPRDGSLPGRIMTAQHPFDPRRVVRASMPTEGFVLSLQPDVYMMHGIENAAGYDGFGMARYSRLAGDMKVWGELMNPEMTLRGPSRELDLLNVRYLLALNPDTKKPGLAPPTSQQETGDARDDNATRDDATTHDNAATRDTASTRDDAVMRNDTATRDDAAMRDDSRARDRWLSLARLGDVSVFENTRALPRAWLAASESVLSDEQEIEAIRTGRLPGGGAWEPLQTALVESPTGVKFDAASHARRASVTRHEPNRVSVETDCDAPSLLVLSENYYPGWRAYVDAREARILRVDYGLRGVALAAGAHTVEFLYRPRSVILGALVSLSTLAALLLFGARIDEKVRGRWKRRRAVAAETSERAEA